MSVLDIDGNEYKTKKIGNQIWMAENLRVSHYRNGDPILIVANRNLWKQMACEAYLDSIFGEIQCFLYTWHAVSDPRGLAPQGWHIPTDKEWKILVQHLGGKKSAGGKLKAKGTDFWKAPNLGADNSSGFMALPFGFMGVLNSFHGAVGESANFWTSSDRKFRGAIYRVMGANFTAVNRFFDSKEYGMSVRCIKD